MKLSEIEQAENEATDVKLKSQTCHIQKDGTLEFRWEFEYKKDDFWGLHTITTFVDLKEIAKTKDWVSRYSQGWMK